MFINQSLAALARLEPSLTKAQLWHSQSEHDTFPAQWRFGFGQVWHLPNLTAEQYEMRYDVTQPGIHILRLWHGYEGR